ncbi:MAG: metallophosphoesterase family protein [Promethearchaeota archaeon]
MFTLLAISDLAGKLPRIPEASLSRASLFLIAGDITLGAKSENHASKFFSKLHSFFPSSKQVYFIPGNHDNEFVSRKHDWTPENFKLLHDRWAIHEVESKYVEDSMKLLLLGFGGATLGLYNNFAFTEDEIYTHLVYLFNQVECLRIKDEVFTVLLVHDPPFRTSLDINYNGEHVGSKSIRRIVERYQPEMLISGHIHESQSIDRIRRTILVNCGEGKFNHHVMVNIEGIKKKNVIIELK